MAVYPTVDGKGVLIPPPSRPLQESVKFNSLVLSFDSGHEQRRSKGLPKKSWDIQYLALGNEAKKTIQAFFIARGGSREAFTWTHPETKETFSVRFDGDTLQTECFGQHPKLGALWKVSFKVVQVF